MNWSSWSEFVSMGGWGPYVWAAWLMMLAAFGAEAAALSVRRRNVLRFVRDLEAEAPATQAQERA